MICFSEFENEELLKFCNDKHIFCKSCMNLYVNTQYNKYDHHYSHTLLDIYCPYCKNIIKKEGAMKIINGKKEGLFTSYHINFQLNEKYFYKNNNVEGLYEKYYNNGILQIECYYINNQRNGFYIEYYKNGVMKSKCNYINSKKNGLYIEYYESGKMKLRNNYINGLLNGYEEEYYENGVLKSESYYLNNENIFLKKYDEKGNNIYTKKYIINYFLDKMYSIF